MHPNDRATVPLFSDAATVTWIGLGNENSLGKSVFGTNGAFAEALIVRNSGTRLCEDDNGSRGFLYMDGRTIYEYMLRNIPAVVRDCLKKNHLKIAEC